MIAEPRRPTHTGDGRAAGDGQPFGSAQVEADPPQLRHARRPCSEGGLQKLTPQHLRLHGLDLQEGYRRYPELGFTKGARLLIQPSPEGLLNTGKVFGLVVAGAGFEPATFGL